MDCRASADGNVDASQPSALLAPAKVKMMQCTNTIIPGTDRPVFARLGHRVMSP
jgi:hypothetical protein